MHPPQAIFAKGYGTVFDSGTTFSYLPTAVFGAFLRTLEASLAGKGLRRSSGPDAAVRRARAQRARTCVRHASFSPCQLCAASC